MKHLIIAILSVSLLSFTGCCTTKKPAPKAVVAARPSIKSTQAAVDRAMSTYGRAVASKKLDAQQQSRVDMLYVKYQGLFRSFVTNAKLDHSAETPERVADAAGKLIKAVAATAK